LPDSRRYPDFKERKKMAHAAMGDDETRGSRDEATFTRTDDSGDAAAEDNRRIHPRFAVDLDVTMSSEHNFYAGFAENISSGGLFIATHVLKPVGERLEITVNVPDRADPVRCLGEVRWVREYSEQSNVPPGLGIRFIGLPATDAEAIERFLKDREPLFYDED
jgi:uncharacterized protein (TIGR02266 family)